LDVQYREQFLKDLKKLKKQPIYRQVLELTFTTLPQAESLQAIANVKAMAGYPGRYRIRIGDYRVGIEVQDQTLEIIRVMHRRDFYRYFP
jgi:mRNA interferase RelE/StbE